MEIAQRADLPFAISIRDAMLRDAAPAGAGSTFDGLRALGINAVELDLQPDGSLPLLLIEGKAPFSLADSGQIAVVRDRLAEESVRVSALLLATDFAGEHREAHVRWTVSAIAAAEALGAPTVRIDVTHQRDLPIDDIRERFMQSVESILRQTSESPVNLGIENHGWISNDPAFLDSVFALVENRRLGLTLDTGNFYWYGFPLTELYALIERYAGRVRHTHIKSINYPPELANQHRPIGFEYGRYCCPLDDGNLDLSRIVRALLAAGYSGDLCIEDESLGKYPSAERMSVLQRDVAAVRKAIAVQ